MKALVLAGGGAKGAYQMGAWRAFNELQKSFDIITGTSVGALNATMMIQGDYEKAYDLWYNIRPDLIVKGDAALLDKVVKMDVGVGNLKSIIDFFAKTVGQKGLDVTPFKELIEHYVDEEKVRASKIKLGIVTVSLTDFKPSEITIDDIPKGQLNDYLLASCNLPVFKMERLHDKLYIDGGFYDNLPINLAKRMGATTFTVVELGAVGIKQKSKVAIETFICPSENIGGLLELTPTLTRNNLKLGYYDTLRAYRGYKGKYYYIEQDIDNMTILHQLLEIESKNIDYMADVFGIKKRNNTRLLLEKIIPDVQQVLKLPYNCSYGDIFIGVLERIAQSLNIDRFEIKKLSKFKKEIDSAYLTGNIISNNRSVIDKLFAQIRSFADDQQINYFNTIYEKIMR